MNLTLISIENNGLIRIASEGDLKLQSTEPASNPLRALLGDQWPTYRILVDLSRTQHMNSAAIGWLIKSASQSREAGGRLIVHSVQPPVRTVFDLLKLDQAVVIAPDESAARAVLADAGP